MHEILTPLIDRLAQPKPLLGLFLAVIALTSLFASVQPEVDPERLPPDVKQDDEKLERWLDNPTLDGRPLYRPADVHRVLASYAGPGERRLYAVRELTLDMVYPVVYGLFGTAALVFLLGGLAQSCPWLYALRWLPCWMALCDVVENLTLAGLAIRYKPGEPAWVMASIARGASAGKWVLAVGSLALLLVGLAYVVWTLLARPLRRPA